MKKCEWCLEKEIIKNRFCSITCKNRFISSKNDYKSIAEKIKKPKNFGLCLYCNKEFIKNQLEQKYCNHSCAATHSNLNRNPNVYKKHSEILKEKFKHNELHFSNVKTKNISIKINKICIFCNKEFIVNPSSKQKYCSVDCTPQKRRSFELKNSLKQYRRQCNFTFGLSMFPEEFDFEMIKTYGWYSPSNKKNNLEGVSRDHKFSIREGFELKVPIHIMKHPANCVLMKHTKNISKGKKSSITLDELYILIDKWDKKYNSNLEVK